MWIMLGLRDISILAAWQGPLGYFLLYSSVSVLMPTVFLVQLSQAMDAEESYAETEMQPHPCSGIAFPSTNCREAHSSSRSEVSLSPTEIAS